MMYKKIALIFSIFLFSNSIISQENIEFYPDLFPNQRKEFRQAVKYIEEGEKFFDSDFPDYYIAIEFFLNAYDFNPNNALLNYKIGICYIEVKPVAKSIFHLNKALKLDSNVSENIYYYLARAYYKNNDFDTALYLYKKYRKSLPTHIAMDNETKANLAIEQCEYAKSLYETPVNVNIKNAGSNINTKYSDYGPAITADESVLFFTSRRKTSTGGLKDPGDGIYYEDIFVAGKKDSSFAKAVNLSTNINSRYHEAVVGVSPDGQTLYIYKDDRGGDLYISKLIYTEWTKPMPIPNVNTKFKESSASLSYDNKTLFFTSDRDGGYGKSDIYYVELKNNGEWSDAKNIGRPINSDGNEIAVFMHPDGKTIYFSSDGHKSMGGYDVFKSVFKDGKWSEPINLGYPINTVDDDIFFYLSASGKTAYYSSEKSNGYGKQDIYIIEFESNIKRDSNYIAKFEGRKSEPTEAKDLDIETTFLTLLTGTVKDFESSQPIGAKIEVVDNSENELIAEFRANQATGNFIISLPSGKNYGIAVSADGYLFHSENFNISENSGFRSVVKNIELKRVKTGSEIALNNIFFDYKKANLTDESKTELNRLIRLLMDYPEIKIEVSGHTDNIGSAEYNKELSKSRAKAVVDYLIENGIDSNRLSFIGYGFEKPVETNKTQEGRQANRRSEFRIIE